ncbi:MAG: VWA domain-containing protein, partial [Gammaproteobacteria bacterium]|nr:VWA domain-containing protein [Gammaproteobacteria bacterium]
ASVAVSASTDSAVGPWLPLGEIDLADGRVEGRLELAQPAWARFVRFTATRKEGGRGPYAPDAIRIWERPTGDTYRSVLTEWGDLTSRAYYELQAGLQPEASLKPVNNTVRQRAAAIAVGQTAFGQVSLGKQEHWYRLAMPAGDNTLTLQLDGDPTVRTRLALEDSAGQEIPFKRNASKETPARHVMAAIVEPGSEVWISVAEPPRNVVFTWDTSASVNAYIPQTNNSLVAFSSQVVPGREAVNLMPFSNSLLLDEWYGEPYMLQTTLNDYRRRSSSSSAHGTLKNATRSMQNLPGTKAVIIITDGDSPNDGGVWGPLQEVRPRVFSIGVAGAERFMQDSLRDWSHVNGGHFTQLRYDGEMEVAFDRATTLMHRPAGYRLVASSEYREAPGPGLLSVVAGGSGGASAAAVELILDASGSMLKRIDGKRRIVVAKDVLTEAVRNHIPAGTPVALRVFGHKEVDSCRTDLEIPLAALDPDAAAAKIAGINAMNLARTPIADSLAAVEGDLQGAPSGIIVLVTDGEETCEGDPGKVIETVRDKGFNVSLNIVGFAIDDAELAAQFESWAELGGGRYLGASDAADLSVAIEQALRIAYTVYDRGGNEVATGVVGGEPLKIERGLYRVVVNSAPKQSFDGVTLQGEDTVTLRLE